MLDIQQIKNIHADLVVWLEDERKRVDQLNGRLDVLAHTLENLHGRIVLIENNWE